MDSLKPRDMLPHERIDPVYDKFLYAQLGEEANGMQLSVLSALARQNMDPWEIAQKLSVLPREPAVRFLTPLLACVPGDVPEREAPEVIAARLIAMLPSLAISDRKAGPAYSEHPHAQPNLAIDRIRLFVAFALLLLFGQLLLSSLSPGPTSGKSMSSTASAPTGVSTAPRQ
jgi:hypothetical protein